MVSVEVQKYDNYGLTVVEIDGNEYAIATSEEEANSACKSNIEDSVWAFNPEFIIDHSKLPYEALEMVREFQQKKYEDANPTILALIEDLDEFVSDAISADGRGHFLSGYDGEEKEWRDLILDLSLGDEEEQELREQLMEEFDLTAEELHSCFFYRTN